MRVLGRYRLLEPLGQGGMAQVHLARDEEGGELVVIKMIRPDRRGEERMHLRFAREVRIVQLLAHPNICRFLEVGEHEGDPCIAMEYVAGQTLADLMRELVLASARAPLAVAMTIILGVLRGLGHAHAAVDEAGAPLELVHRDLSASNVLLGDDGSVKIIDFGLARGRMLDFKTAQGQLLGTVRYLSPEQAMGLAIDRRSDLYAAGVLLHEMLSGRALIKNDQPLVMLKQIVAAPAPMLEDVPPALQRAVARALNKEPSLRFQTAGEMAQALGEASGVTASPAVLAELLSALFPGAREARALRAVPSTEQLLSAVTQAAAPPTPASRSGDTRVDTSPAAPPGAAGPARAAEARASTPSLDPTPPLPRGAARTVPLASRTRLARLEGAVARWQRIALAALGAFTLALGGLIFLGKRALEPTAAPAPAVSDTPAPAVRVAPRPTEPEPATAGGAPSPGPAPVPEDRRESRPVEAGRAEAGRRRDSVRLVEARPPVLRQGGPLHRQLALLEAEPRNLDRFQALCDTLEARAAERDLGTAREVRRLVADASLSAEVALLARAVRLLEPDGAAP